MYFKRRRFFGRQHLICTFVLVAMLGVAGWSHAQEPVSHDRIYAVVHVDLVPDAAAAGSKLLREYAAESRKDKGAVRVELYLQFSRTNHFTLVEVWENQQALDAHEAAAHTRKFREQIQPMLGSPFDERLHTLLE